MFAIRKDTTTHVTRNCNKSTMGWAIPLTALLFLAPAISVRAQSLDIKGVLSDPTQTSREFYPEIFSTGKYPISTSYLVPFTSTDPLATGGGEDDFHASVSYGETHSFAHSVTERTGGYQPGIAVSGIASLTSQWTDVLNVTSDTLQLNTPVDLFFNMTNEGSPSASPESDAFAYSIFDVTDTTHGPDNGYASQTYADGIISGDAHENQPGFVFQTIVGDTLTVRGTVTLQASANAYVTGLPAAEATADFSHTTLFYVDSRTAGAQIISASGHDYSSPNATAVPEPGTLPLLGLGLGGVVLAARRRRPQK